MNESPWRRPERPGLRPWTQVRWVEDETWRRFLAVSDLRAVPVGRLLSAVLRDWLSAGDRAAREPCPSCGHTWLACPARAPED